MEIFFRNEVAVLSLTLIYGLIVGSFLNVCIYRIPRKGSIIHPPSFCPQCGTGIHFYDNVPVLSYLYLLGRCRSCGAFISPIYPLVEIFTALLFVLYIKRFGFSLEFFSAAMLTCLCIILIGIDFRHKVLPNVLTLTGTLAGFIFSIFHDSISWTDSLAGILVGGGVLLAVYLLYRLFIGMEGMGMGDVKMMMMVGAFLGWKLALLTIILGSFLGSIAGIIIAIRKKTNLKIALPFGTFLGFAAIFSLIWGTSVVVWYMGMLQ